MPWCGVELLSTTASSSQSLSRETLTLSFYPLQATAHLALQAAQQAPKSLLAANEPQSSNALNQNTPLISLPGSSAAKSAAISSTGRCVLNVKDRTGELAICPSLTLTMCAWC